MELQDDKQSHSDALQPNNPELSNAWRALLGIQVAGGQTDILSSLSPDEAQPDTTMMDMISPIASDPWNQLLHTQGIEVVDLQRVHLPISESELEQALRLMQEQPAEGR
jgi:hypothetical protein